MSSQDQDLPPLPDDLAEGMKALRRVEPSRDLVDRALGGLPDRPARLTARDSDEKEQGSSRWLLGGLIVAPALAAIAFAIYWASGAGGAGSALSRRSPIERSEERAVDLPEEGHAWTHLDLWTHHHDDELAVVHLEVPENVRVRLPGDDGGALERSCEQDRCIHRFTRRHGQGDPVGVAVMEPGRYEIHVHHESDEAQVRERFVLTARD